MRRSLLTLALLVIFLAGCSSDRNCPRRWRSVVEMPDTTALYDLWLMVRVPSLNTECSVPVFISVESPGGEFIAKDTFEVLINRRQIDVSGNDDIRYCMSALSCDVECLYRRGVSPVISGGWNVIMWTGDKSVSDIRMRAVKR